MLIRHPATVTATHTCTQINTNSDSYMQCRHEPTADAAALGAATLLTPTVCAFQINNRGAPFWLRCGVCRGSQHDHQATLPRLERSCARPTSRLRHDMWLLQHAHVHQVADVCSQGTPYEVLPSAEERSRALPWLHAAKMCSELCH